ncbi:hypothetical protein Bhyg_03698 [Pseudolycoriella hygida]|uniref:Uncharacterized protein n=1 Tax=Pseudolycoriella hygida TaxID=35572 RepID=A0A9Q0NDT0_9DIPT|nr:hypothetical protein Bhyg_03698 [Pseudolycoriella hygida]
MMGASNSKSGSVTKVKHNEDDEKSQLVQPAEPTVSHEVTPNELLDPRSPNPNRTPINEITIKPTNPLPKGTDLTNMDDISAILTVTPTKLKNKLLHDLGYTLDPRSPALNFDRTPIMLNDSNISDEFSFASLSLTESNIHTPKYEDHLEVICSPEMENDISDNSEMDPRSPSIDIERSLLNLNVVLLDETKEEAPKVEAETEKANNQEIVANVPTEAVKNMIYVDEHQEQPTTSSVKSDNVDKLVQNRTPLSCLINSKGVEKRSEIRAKIQNRTNLARSIYKESAHNNSASKIPVLRRSISKEVN